jgi:hypothetical protein
LYVCEYYEVLHVRHYVIALVLSHWHHGIEIFIINACAGV